LCILQYFRQNSRQLSIITDQAGGGGGGPGSPCYWKSLNGLILREEGYVTDPQPQHDYGCCGPVNDVKRPSAGSDVASNSDSPVNVDFRQLPPCCRAAAGCMLHHHTGQFTIVQQDKLREHLYEMPSFDLATSHGHTIEQQTRAQ